MIEASDDELQGVAERAFFLIEVEEYPSQRGINNIMTGDGVDDIDSVIRTMERTPFGRFLLDVSPTNSSWKVVTATHMQTLRQDFIAFYGTVNKPDAYAKKRVGQANLLSEL